MEIDGASNNSVDDVRQIRENVRLVPARSRFKIYVIDEVHQLSTSAFNALLKTLEEPPEHAVFVLATTETHKVPATIVSRCQRYDFRRIGLEGIKALLRRILSEEGVACGEEALLAIARAADGSLRDAESILEQMISYCDQEITFDDVFDVLGLVDWAQLRTLCDAILDKDVAKQLGIVEDIVASGKDLSQFVQDVLRYLRNLLVCKTADATALLALPESEIAAMQAQAERFTLTGLIRMVEQFAELSKGFDSQLAQRIALEALLIRISRVSVEMSVDAVIEKLVQLGAGGVAAIGAPSEASTKPVARATPPPAREPAAGAGEVASAEAPAVAEPEGKPAVTMDSLPAHWESIVKEAAHHSLNLGVALGQARPAAVEEDTLVIGFQADHERSKGILEQPENRDAFEAVLREKTVNLTRFRTEDHEVADEGEAGGSSGAVENRLPRGGGVSAQDAHAVLADPGVAKVVDVFKGRIVDVKHGSEQHR